MILNLIFFDFLNLNPTYVVIKSTVDSIIKLLNSNIFKYRKNNIGNNMIIVVLLNLEYILSTPYYSDSNLFKIQLNSYFFLKTLPTYFSYLLIRLLLSLCLISSKNILKLFSNNFEH